MSTMSELVYVDVEVYRPGETEFTDALLDWSDDLWVFPDRPDLSDVMDAVTDEPGDEAEFTTLALHVMPITQHNPAFMQPAWKSYIDWLIEESDAQPRQVFEVDAHERWLPVIQRRMAELPSANRLGFYAVYAVTETTRKDENGTNTSIEFEYVGELDFTRLPLVQA